MTVAHRLLDSARVFETKPFRLTRYVGARVSDDEATWLRTSEQLEELTAPAAKALAK